MGPLSHMGGPPDLENCQWEPNNQGNGNTSHSYCKSMKQITLTYLLQLWSPI